MKTFVKVITTVAFAICGTIAIAPLLGIDVPHTIWGMVIGTIASLVGTLVPSGKERFEISIPSNYTAEIKVHIIENTKPRPSSSGDAQRNGSD